MSFSCPDPEDSENLAYRIPRGMELMDPFDKPVYDHICDVYARDHYGIREVF